MADVLAELLRTNRKKILDHFVSASREERLPPEGASRQVIMDHIGLFLDGCADWLEGQSSRDSESAETVSSRNHGSQRWAVGYDLKDLVREYGVLRQCIVMLIALEKLEVAVPEFDRLADVINVGIAEAATEFARRQEVALREAREEAVAVVMHDLRNPLNTIMGTLRLLESELEAGSIAAESMQKHLARMDRASTSMLRLVTDLQDLSRVEAGRLSLVLTDETARSLIEEAHGQGLPLAALKGVELRVVGIADGTVRCDRGRILQVLSNLVGNAIKFTPRGGAVTLSAVASPAKTRFEVTDTGPGIPKGQMPFLFDRFWQAPEARNKGTGLGLAIAKALVEAHRGHIGVESVVGQGSVFYFSLLRLD